MNRTLGVVGLALVLGSCGGSGGSGGGAPPPPPVRPGNTLQGSVSVPRLGVLAAPACTETRVNDEAHCAEPVGVMTTGGTAEFAGRVAPGGDPQDVWRVELASPMQISVELVAERAALHVFEPSTGREVFRLDAGQRREFALAADSIDIVVAAKGRDADYSVRMATAELADGAELALPLPREAQARESVAQARYLGAQHAMIAGEIVVLRDPEAATEAALEVAGCDLVRGGEIAVYRIHGTESVERFADGAPLEQSLELQTCLAAKRIAEQRGVRAASPNYVYEATATEPNDPLYRLQWHYPQINLPLAWDVTQGSANVTVAVIDTGVVLGHPEFQGRLVNGYDMISDPGTALDGDGIDPNADDPGDGAGAQRSSFHGTHVAGTIAANSNDGTGVAGVDWNCRIMPLRALGQGGRGSLEDIANAILFAAGLPNASGQVPPQRAHVVNMSLGGPGNAPVMEQACADAAAAGVLLIAAAGNDNTANQNFPASYQSVLSVGAVGFDRGRAPYSNFATTVDIWAPGGDMSVDRNGDQQPDGVLSAMAAGFGQSRTAEYDFSQGTSMACPHIAGVASLLVSVNPNLTLQELRNVLRNSGQPGNNLPNGGVLVDANAAVRNASGQPPQRPELVASPNAVNAGSDQTTSVIRLSNPGTGNLAFDQNRSSIQYAQPGVDWLGATLDQPGNNISHTQLSLQFDRSGLRDGDYQATIVLAFADGPNVATTDITVAMRVGQAQVQNEDIFVLVVDAESLDTIGQAVTDRTRNFAFSLDGVAPGEYVLVAGTDRDNDDEIGDDGELFGMWPNSDSPLILAIEGDGNTLSGLNFSLQLNQRLSADRERQTYEKL